MKKENYVATLVGCAIGDALGMPVEGWKREQIRKYVEKIERFIEPVIIYDSQGYEVQKDEFGKLKCYTRDFKKGDYTDDTILTLALAESIVERRGLYLEDIAKKQLAEYEKRILLDGRVFGGFGGTTMDAFKNLQKGMSPLHSGVIGGPGNAPAMKMSPVGLYMHSTDNYDLGLLFSEKVGKITHLDPRSVASGVVHAHCVYSLLKDVSRMDFVDSAVDVCKRFESPVTKEFNLSKMGSLLSRLEWIRENMDVTDEEAFQKLGATSLVFRSYPFALFMFQKHWDNPIEGLVETVNYGGDCDTTGAIYGTLAGAKNGMIFPIDWEINGLNKIINCGEELWRL